ncbi:homoserine kinase [Phenylobacterium sp.]|uniref:homoserine kinase n=1 Tax=Phenylobacterium sp. TaxID=1871053 RepID=UPI0025D1DFC2|nr:homoserine kinase [Phenylobacterium sp.]MBX3484161.1 homoserine kinase [Phenylobacterium sp.]MCW5759212.1 homoserine kinase [Phenylobacterium sp.]
MAVYTDITDEELAGLLADFDIGQATSFKGIAEGVENSNFLLETTKGRYFLTVYEKRVREEDLPFFLGLMQWLERHGFPSAAPIADRNGEILKRMRGKPCALVSFLTGLSVRRPTVAHCREAGESLARLHIAGDGFPMARVNDLGQPYWAPMFANLTGDAEKLKPGLSKVIAGDLELLARRWPRGLPEGVIHADYFPDNVFFTAGRFAAAFDFYFACTDALAYDIAVALNAWCFEPDGSFNITAARALVGGYESRRKLTDAERAALPVLAHGAAMRFFLTRLHDWHATPAGALVKPKDPLEYERKLAVHRSSPDLVLFGTPA